MKNPFEKSISRREEFDKTKENIKKNEIKIEKNNAPFGHLRQEVGPFGDMCHETLNYIASLPNLPETKLLEIRVKMAQKKLEKIYLNDENNAHKLNKQYNEIIKKANETGDNTKRKEFEKNMLGMEEELV